MPEVSLFHYTSVRANVIASNVADETYQLELKDLTFSESFVSAACLKQVQLMREIG